MTIKKAAIPFRIMTIITLAVGTAMLNSYVEMCEYIEKVGYIKNIRKEHFFGIINNWTTEYYAYIICLVVCLVLSLIFFKANETSTSIFRTLSIGTALGAALFSFNIIKVFHESAKMEWIDDPNGKAATKLTEDLKLLDNVDDSTAKMILQVCSVFILAILSITAVVAIVKALNPIESYVAPKQNNFNYQQQYPQQNYQQNFQQQAPKQYQQNYQHQVSQPIQQQYQQQAPQMSEPSQNYQQDYAQQPPQMEEAQQLPQDPH